MNTTSGQTVIDNKYHQLGMLLWQADLDERNGKKQEASNIREWLAAFLSANWRKQSGIHPQNNFPGRPLSAARLI